MLCRRNVDTVNTVSFSQFVTSLRAAFEAAIEYHLHSGGAAASVRLGEAATELLAAFNEQVADQMDELCPVDSDRERLAALQLSATTLIVVPPALVSAAHCHDG
jgi:hypothetical protein